MAPPDLLRMCDDHVLEYLTNRIRGGAFSRDAWIARLDAALADDRPAQLHETWSPLSCGDSSDVA